MVLWPCSSCSCCCTSSPMCLMRFGRCHCAHAALSKQTAAGGCHVLEKIEKNLGEWMVNGLLKGILIFLCFNTDDNTGICTICGGILTTSPPHHCKWLWLGGDHPWVLKLPYFMSVGYPNLSPSIWRGESRVSRDMDTLRIVRKDLRWERHVYNRRLDADFS